MVTFRERYLARYGVGHADRPRLDHALGVDAKPWRLRVSSAWCANSVANSDGFTNSNCNGYGDGNTNSNCNTNFYARSKSYAHTEAAPHAAAPAIARS